MPSLRRAAIPLYVSQPRFPKAPAKGAVRVMINVSRGDIFYADFNPAQGSEQGGVRPCLIVQNDVGNLHSPTVVAVPLTTNTSKNRLPTHVRIPRSCGLEMDSFALAEQIRTIDKSRLGSYVGRIGSGIQEKVDRAMSINLELANPKNTT